MENHREFRPSNDLTRKILAVLFVIALIASAAWIMRPFFSSLLWATVIVISTWPVLLAVQSRLGVRRGIATAVMTTALLLVLLIPLSVAIGALIANIDTIVAKANALQDLRLPALPDWVARIPFRGPQLAAEWRRLSAEGPGSLSARIAPYVGPFLQWFAIQLGGLGGTILQFLLTAIFSAVLYANGETVGSGVRRFAARLAGMRGDRAAVLAAGTIRAVAMGVILTAIVQTTIAGVGLAVASVPATSLLLGAVFILCLAQVGPLLVMVPAVVWKFHSGDSVYGVVLLAFALVSGTIDNFMRPVLIKRGADLPLLLIFGGVIGGMISLGVMGIFVGPAILAVTWVLLRDWVNSDPWAEERPLPPRALPVTRSTN